MGIEAPRPSVVTAGNSSAPAQVEALRHSATDDGGRRRRERELEVPVQVHVVRRDNAGDAVLLDEADGEEPRDRSDREMRTGNGLVTKELHTFWCAFTCRCGFLTAPTSIPHATAAI